MLGVTAEAVRVSRGLVIWICAGVTRKWCYQPGPEGLLYEWWKAGGRCWRPAYWHRVGIPGSGGKQWLRADIEYALCFTKCVAAIPFADNTANGHAPKWAPGGDMSYRVADGARINEWGRYEASDSGSRKKNGDGRNGVKKFRDKWGGTTEENRKGGEGRNSNGKRKTRRTSEVSSLGSSDCGSDSSLQDGQSTDGGYQLFQGGTIEEKAATRKRQVPGAKQITRRISQGHGPDGDTRQDDVYVPPVLANPGVLIRGIKVGGGLMGHQLAHSNEAPYPLKLAQWFIRSWCPHGGRVLDPFSGSGTTVHAAMTLGRIGVGGDLRLSQCQLARRRCSEVQMELI